MKNFFRKYWWTLPLGLIIVISLFGTYLSVNYYWTQFHETTKSNDPQAWGVFGDYMGGTLTPLLELISISITIWLTIIVNKYARFNTDRQIESERMVAKIQLRHDALKELRLDLNNSFINWRQSNNNLAYANKCSSVLNSFAESYDYLFDLNNIQSFVKLTRIINKAILSIQNNNLVNILQDFMQADMGRQALYADLGEKVIE